MTYKEVTGEDCPQLAIGGDTDAKGVLTLRIAGQQIGLLFNPNETAVKLTKAKRNRFLNQVAYLAK